MCNLFPVLGDDKEETDRSRAGVYANGSTSSPLGGGSVDLSGLDPALFSRAEVIAGPQGAAFGAGALGGVLSLSPWPKPAA